MKQTAPEKKTEKKELKEKKPAPSAIAPTPAKPYSGKWIVTKEEGGKYSFELHASNGEKMLSGGIYTSLAGARNGIETYKANIKKGNFKIIQTKSGDYLFQLFTARGTLLAHGESYKSRASCESAMESTKRFAASAAIEEEEEETK